MTPADLHDRTRDAVVAALRDFFGPAGEWSVYTRVGWDRPDNRGPGNDPMTFDVAIARVGSPAVTGPDGPRLGADVLPALVFEVVDPDDREQDLYDKPDLLMNAGVGEYDLYDPAGLALRPSFEVWRLKGGVYQRSGSVAAGVAFRDLRFRMEFVGGEPRLTPSGPADAEDELFRCERQLARAVEVADRERRAVDGLTKKVDRLRAELGRGAS